MKISSNTKRGFSIPEVIVAISILTLVILTATNLLVSSMRANRNNVDRIIAYNLAQEALEGVRNIRDGNWLQNQYWRGDSTYNFFGTPFNKDGKYIIKRKHNLFTEDQCKQGINSINGKDIVKSASPWDIVAYNDEASKLYYKNTNNRVEYVHEPGLNDSGFRRWVEITTIHYDGSDADNKNKLKILVTATVEWMENSHPKSMNISTILTDWKSGTI